MHADFGSGLWDGGPIGIPITVVGKGQPKSAVRFEYADECDRGPVPDPGRREDRGRRGPDGDRHAMIVDRDACRLYELYALRRLGGGWTAGLGRDLEPALEPRCAPPAGRRRTPPACRSCPGSRATTRSRGPRSTTRSGSPCPARAAPTSGRRGTSRARSPIPALPPMGARLRLKASFDISRLPAPGARRARGAEALRDDRGRQRLDWFVTGAPDPRWSNDDLHTLGRVPGSAFEVVDTSSLRP